MVTKTQKNHFRTVKNLVTQGADDTAATYKQVNMMNERHYHDAVEAGHKARIHA